MLVLGCGRDVVFVDPPPAGSHTDSTGSDTTGSDTTGTDTTNARRVDLFVTVTIDTADTALARRVGLAHGRLSGAQVRATRSLGLQVPQTGITDSLGRVALPRLIEGFWTLTIIRPLTQAERSALDSADREVTGFGGMYQDIFDQDGEQVGVTARAGRQGTLVISEGYLPSGEAPKQSAQYLEVHNNSFDTVYLDQKIIGRSFPFVTDTPTLPCSTTVRWREDPEGIWTRFLWAFPGTGRNFPLPPGATAVVATDAVNHGAIFPGLLDLSRADFEFIGANDVDNPAVPNMDNFPGWSDLGDPIGHGPFWIGRLSIYLAEPLNPDTLPQDNLPVASPRHFRAPAGSILDVLTSGDTPETAPTNPWCAAFVHPRFDGRFAELMSGSIDRSTARMPLAGTSLLQRLKISAADFAHRSPANPGEVP
jgi:hypothetical protein